MKKALLISRLTSIITPLLFCFTLPLNAGNIILPPDFDWNNIPPGYARKTLEIKHHFKPAGVDVVLPENVTLLFKNGSLKAIRSLVAHNTTIIAKRTRIFDPSTIFSGSFLKTSALPEWFGAAGDNASVDAEAVAAAIRAFPEILFSAKYFIPDVNIIINKPTILKGLPGSLIRGNNSNTNRFTVKNSLTVNNISFSGFRSCFFFDHDQTIDGVSFTDNSFTGIGKPLYASNSNLKQKIINVDINGNTFEKCTSGVELLTWLKYVNICNNIFSDLGGKDLNAQANAVRLGNTAINYHNDTAKGDYMICGNRITNVFCGPNPAGPEGYECHAVFATGNRIVIINNQIENVYNGGVGKNHRIKTGSEGIYIKANSCKIAGNNLINAGFGEGAICSKGFNTNMLISENTLKYLSDIADYSQLIACYYSGDITIEKNLLESKAGETTAIKLCNNDKSTSVATITGNTLSILSGYAFRILNRKSGASVIISNNPGISLSGSILKEESDKNYSLQLSDNTIDVHDGSFLPSTKFNDLTLTNNNIRVNGKTSTGNLWNKSLISGNTFEVYSSSPALPLFIMNHRSIFINNTVILHGSWRNVLMFCNEESGRISGNIFRLENSDKKPERVIFINTSTPGLNVEISGNSFSGGGSHGNTIMVSISNSGIKNLTVENNTADRNTGTFLEIISTVDKAIFKNNKTLSRSGFISENSLKRIKSDWSSFKTTGLPERKFSK